jgi:IS30 family transposase
MQDKQITIRPLAESLGVGKRTVTREMFGNEFAEREDLFEVEELINC